MNENVVEKISCSMEAESNREQIRHGAGPTAAVQEVAEHGKRLEYSIQDTGRAEYRALGW